MEFSTRERNAICEEAKFSFIQVRSSLFGWTFNIAWLDGWMEKKGHTNRELYYFLNSNDKSHQKNSTGIFTTCLSGRACFPSNGTSRSSRESRQVSHFHQYMCSSTKKEKYRISHSWFLPFIYYFHYQNYPAILPPSAFVLIVSISSGMQ